MAQTLKLVEQAIQAALSRTLEEMAFEQVDRITDEERIAAFEKEPESPESNPEAAPEESIPAAEKIWSVCPLTSPLKGDILIVMEKEQALQISEALFSFMEDETGEEMVSDAVSEMLNTIAGCFMKELIPPDQGYEIGFPRTGKGKSPDIEKQVLQIYYETSQHLLKVVLGGDAFKKYDAFGAAHQEVSE